jgi:hypothetical protein
VRIEGSTPGTKYKFSIVAKNADGKSTKAIIKTVTTPKYTACTGFSAVSKSAAQTSVTLKGRTSEAMVLSTGYYKLTVWDAKGTTVLATIVIPADGGSSGTGGGLVATPFFAFSGKTTIVIGVTVEGLTPATKYTFKLQAIATDGIGRDGGSFLAASTIATVKASTKR